MGTGTGLERSEGEQSLADGVGALESFQGEVRLGTKERSQQHFWSSGVWGAPVQGVSGELQAW